MRISSPLTVTVLACALVGAVILGPAACGSAEGDEGDGTEGDGSEGEEQHLEYTDAGIPERPDAGPPVEVEVCFPIAPLPADQLPRCTAETKDCVAACPEGQPGDECRNTCWATDPTPPIGDTGCDDCVFTQLLSCIDAAPNEVCHPAVAAYLCCLFAGGVGCEDEGNALFSCGFVSAPTCFDLTGGEIGKCYAEAT